MAPVSSAEWRYIRFDDIRHQLQAQRSPLRSSGAVGMFHAHVGYQCLLWSRKENRTQSAPDQRKKGWSRRRNRGAELETPRRSPPSHRRKSIRSTGRNTTLVSHHRRSSERAGTRMALEPCFQAPADNGSYVQTSLIVMYGRLATMSGASPDQAHGGVRIKEVRFIVRFCSDDCGTP